MGNFEFSYKHFADLLFETNRCEKMSISRIAVIAATVSLLALARSAATSTLFRPSFKQNDESLRSYEGGSRAGGDIEIGPDPDFQCPDGTIVAPHPEKCELYYTCYNGSPVTLWQCYSDYLFDLTYSGCNFPTQVDCGDRQRPTTTTTVPPFTCLENGFYPVSDCSSQYYLCVAGEVYPQICPNGGIFDPSQGYCVSENQVPACQKTTASSTSTTTDSTESTTITSCSTPKPIDCTSDGFYAFEPCLTVYYACVDGVAYFQQCPNDWIFVEADSSCKRPDQTDCFDSTTNTAAPTETTTASNCDLTTPANYEFSCPNGETDFYPVSPGACVADYYTCYLGVAYPQSCPEGYIFDGTTKQCITPDLASCTPCVTVISSQVRMTRTGRIL